MKRHGIKDCAPNSGSLEMFHEFISFGMSDCVLVPNMVVSGGSDGGDCLAFAEAVVIDFGNFLSSDCPGI